MSKITIIVPVYNVEGYLSSCLDSIYGQTCQDFDVILVDDGATDSSPKICDEYGVKYPDKTRVIHQENMGLGGARDSAIPAARGDYLFFVDSDDTIEPDTVERVVREIDKYSPDCVCITWQSVDEAGRVLESRPRTQFESGKLYSVEENPSIITGTPSACDKIFKRELFVKSGITFPSRVWYEDMRTTPKLFALCKNFVCINEPLYNYLLRSGSIMNNKDVMRNREILLAMEDLISFFKANGLYEKYREELEFLVIDHVLVSATVRVLRTESAGHPLVKEFRDFTAKNVKSVKENKYIAAMPRSRNIVLRLLSAKMYFAVIFIFRYIKKNK